MIHDSAEIAFLISVCMVVLCVVLIETVHYSKTGHFESFQDVMNDNYVNSSNISVNQTVKEVGKN